VIGKQKRPIEVSGDPLDINDFILLGWKGLRLNYMKDTFGWKFDTIFNQMVDNHLWA